jgi:hypothetical protein
LIETELDTMQFTKTKAIALGAAAAGVAAIIASAAPASAATNYTVTPGGAVKAANVGNLVFTDTSSTSATKPKLTCTKFNASGTAVAGGHAFVPVTYPGSPTGLDSAGSFTPTGTSLTGCTNPIVGATNVTPSGTWKLGVSSKSGTTATGYLYGVTAHVAAASGTCQFNAAGAVYGTYSSTTGKFTAATTSGLKITGVTGTSCPLVGIHNNDLANLTGVVQLTPHIVIT